MNRRRSTKSVRSLEELQLDDESENKPKSKQTRRTHSEEFKREAVKLLLDQQLSVAEGARNLGIHPNLLRSWRQRIVAEQDGLTEDERLEIARLRAENRRLRMERDILKKAAAFFANEKN